MFDGRHCIEADYALLNKETDKIIRIVLTNLESCKTELNKYLKLVARFDIETSEMLSFKLSSKDMTPDQIVAIINLYIDILKQQILVDINEHR